MNKPNESSRGRGSPFFIFKKRYTGRVELLKSRIFGSYGIITSTMAVVGLAQRNVGRVARTNAFEVISRVNYQATHVRNSEKS